MLYVTISRVEKNNISIISFEKKITYQNFQISRRRKEIFPNPFMMICIVDVRNFFVKRIFTESEYTGVTGIVSPLNKVFSAISAYR